MFPSSGTARPHGSGRRRSRGMALAEFTLAAIPLLLAGFAVMEIGRWQLTRSALGHALLEAARGGQDGWQRPDRVRERFELALLPLWGADASASSQEAARHRLRTTAAAFQTQAAAPLWHIEPAAVPVPGGERHSLALQLTYWHRPWVPGMASLLRQLGRLPPDTELRTVMRKTGWLPIRQRLALEWQLREVEPPGTGSPTSPAPPSLTSVSAETGSATLTDAQHAWQFPGHGGLFVPRCPPGGCPAGGTPPSDENVTPDELCGTVLCCPP